ncbi:MAG: SDR family NAD(P)-dependent oxidoreductase [Bacteroidota bacterium]
MTASLLENNVIVITGAAGRLGQRLVKAFAEAGATIVALVYKAEEAYDLPFPAEAEGWAFPVDVTDEAQVQEVFAHIREQIGPVDAVIHTVGTWDMAPFAETSLADWQEMIDLNLTSTFLTFREAIKVMNSGGRLIGYTSAHGADGGQAQQGAYGAAKAGVIRLIEAIADEYADQGITAHALAPSTIAYDGESEGVSADDLVDLTMMVAMAPAAPLSGQVIKAY